MQARLGPLESPQRLGIFDSLGDGMMNMSGSPMMVPGGSRGSKAPKSKKEEGDDDKYTTVMLRNIPNKYTRGMLIEQLHRSGFRGDVDYLYLPTDFANRCNVGYCFINLRTPLARARFTNAFDGVAAQSCLPGFNSYKVCQVTRAKWQGRDENVRRLRSGPELMAQLAAHPDWLPLLLDEEGNQEPFLCDDGVPSAQGSVIPRRQRGKRQIQFGPGPLMPPGPGDVWPLGMNGLGLDSLANALGGRGLDRGGGRRRRGGRGLPHGPGFADLAAASGGFGVPMALPVPVMTEQGVQYLPYEAAAAAAAYGEAGSYFLAYPAMAAEQQIYGMPYPASYPGFPAGYGWPDVGGEIDHGVPPRQPRGRRRGPGVPEAVMEQTVVDVDEDSEGDLQD